MIQHITESNLFQIAIEIIETTAEDDKFIRFTKILHQLCDYGTNDIAKFRVLNYTRVRLCALRDNPSATNESQRIAVNRSLATIVGCIDTELEIFIHHRLPLDDPSGIYEIPISYVARPVYNASNSRLVYEVTVSNTDGYSYTKTFTRDFYNLLTVYTSWTGRDNTAGRLEDVTAVAEIKTWTGPTFYTRLLSLDDGPTMPVIANDGFAFKGWYADKELTQKVSGANPYQHPMTAYRDTLYTEFVKEWVYIYTKLDEVLLVSDAPHRSDKAKQAFIVLPGSRCTISGKDGRFVSVWWDKPETSMIRRIVSTDNPYSFIATANMTLIPGYDAVSKEELTSDRTATSTDQTPRR